ncbi:hypothetical protein AC579_1353 [Pseudocercospora musae]|uniref:Uncharacterized protein n=1 Tax=Pseudocercospora musae TaxID=113226 RepID=A0A139IKE8_9PEZI|nr:hypothetical protein AC579_1353 [Pseudocercospora musae]
MKRRQKDPSPMQKQSPSAQRSQQTTWPAQISSPRLGSQSHPVEFFDRYIVLGRTYLNPPSAQLNKALPAHNTIELLAYNILPAHLQHKTA